MNNHGKGVARVKHWDGELLICSTCKVPKPENEFGPDKRNKHRHYKNNMCNACNKISSNRRIKILYDRDDLVFYLRRLFNGISYRCRNNPKYKKLGFDLIREDLIDLYNKQEGKCAISGIQMTHYIGKNQGYHHNNVSVDRIDSTKGYIKENIQLVCTTVNLMKSNMSLEELKYFCNLIIQNNA
jgi:hypothetical protein